jgi:hypothetical protein
VIRERQLQSLLSQLMHPNPSKRLTLAQAKNHPFTSRDGRASLRQKRCVPIVGSIIQFRVRRF